MNQPTNAPTRKVTASTGAGAATIVLVWVAGLFGLDVPPEVAAAVATLLALVAGYMTPERAPQPAPEPYVGEHRLDND